MQLLSTKTQIPPIRPALVARTDLIARLDHALAAGVGLFLVSAPAGYGKTTLLANWLAHLAHASAGENAALPAVHCGWLTLDDSDNDAFRFVSYLDAALGQAAAAHVLTAAVPAARETWSATLPPLINAIAGLSDAVLLVLDDYHHIAAQGVHDLVAALLDFMPANLHLAISTRADPPLPLARLRGRGQIVEVRQQDLRFSAAEAAQYLDQVLATPLAREQVAALTNRTEGWIAGLQMAAVSLQGRPDVAEFIDEFAGSHRHILDYLSEEVYRSQPTAVQRFLVQTAVLDRFDARLCAAVLTPDAATETPVTVQEAQRILEHLEHANLFVVPLDDARTWYRYHHLFADLLRLRLTQEEPEAAAQLHLRASRWFAAHDFLHEAIGHALAAGQPDHAAQLMEQAAEGTMMSSGVGALRAWLEALPASTLASHPLLCVYKAGALLLTGAPPEQVETLLRTALESRQAAVGGPVEVYQALLAAYQGRDDASTRLARHALELLPEHSPYFRSFALLLLALNTLSSDDDAEAAAQLYAALELSDRAGNAMNGILARCHLAELAVVRNRLAEAERLYRGALALANQFEHPENLRSFPLIGLGMLAYERNELALAQHHLEQGVNLLGSWGQQVGIQGFITLARVRRALGDEAGASAQEQAADAILEHSQAAADVMGRHALLRRALAALQSGDIATGEQMARAALVTGDLAAPAGDGSILHSQAAFVRAQLLSLRGSQRAALAELEAVQRTAAQHGRARLVLQALVEQALVQRRAGHVAAALDVLDAALHLAAPVGLVRIFVDCGPPMADLLRLAQRRGTEPAFTTRLLAAFAPPDERPPALSPVRVSAGAAPAVELSARELEILVLVAQGMTNQEIALHLTVAVSTIKTHINNICHKFAVPNRTAAVNAARRQHLLPPE